MIAADCSSSVLKVASVSGICSSRVGHCWSVAVTFVIEMSTSDLSTSDASTSSLGSGPVHLKMCSSRGDKVWIGRTVSHHASYAGCIIKETLSFLVMRGVGLNAVDKSGQIVLHHARKEG